MPNLLRAGVSGKLGAPYLWVGHWRINARCRPRHLWRHLRHGVVL